MPANREETIDFVAKAVMEVKSGQMSKEEMIKYIVAITEAMFLIHKSI